MECNKYDYDYDYDDTTDVKKAESQATLNTFLEHNSWDALKKNCRSTGNSADMLKEAILRVKVTSKAKVSF
jgi:hypothetical protein